MCWVNDGHPGLDCSSVAGPTKTEIDTWDTMREVLSYLKEAVPLPRNAHIDPSYTALCEEKQYGLYTNLAKLAAQGDSLDAYRQH